MQKSAGHLLEREFCWEVAFAYNSERPGESGTFGRRSYHEILLTRYVKQALMQISEEKDAFIRDGIAETAQSIWRNACTMVQDA